MLRQIFTLIFILLATSANAYSRNRIVMAVSESYAPPYSFKDKAVIKDGIIKQVGDALAEELNTQIEYKVLPVLRVYQFLFSNQINMICFESESWNQDVVDKVNWSPALFKERELILSSKEKELNSITDFRGILGTITGYQYPKTEPLINSRQLVRADTNSLHSNLSKLNINRLHFVLDESIPVYYLLKEKGYDFNIWDPKINPHVSFLKDYLNEYELKCSYSKYLNKEKINAAFQRLIDKNKIKKILESYGYK